MEVTQARAGAGWIEVIAGSMFSGKSEELIRRLRRAQIARGGQIHRRDAHVAVRDDVVLGIAIVDLRLEDLDLAAGDLGAAQPADELFALPAEHAADDHFDPAMAWLAHDVHC